MERFITKQRSTCDSEQIGRFRRGKRMPPFLRLDCRPTEDNSSPNHCQCGPMEDSRGETSQCRMKNIKNYLTLGGLWESALSFGGACMSTKQNLTSVPASYEIIENRNNSKVEPDPIHDRNNGDLRKSKMCDSVEKRDNFYNTATKFCQGFGFGCKKNLYSPFSNYYKNRNPLNNHNQDQSMDLFKNFHKKTCKTYSQVMKRAAQKSDARPSYHGVDQNQQMANRDSELYNGCSSPRTNMNWRERSPRFNRTWNRNSVCVHESKPTEKITRNSKDDVKPNAAVVNVTPTDNVNLERITKETDISARCLSKEETVSREPSVDDCGVHIDWFTYGDTGYATAGVTDATDKKCEKHWELYELVNTEPIDNPRLQSSDPGQNENEVQPNHCNVGLSESPDVGDHAVTVSETSNCDKPNFDSHSKPFHCPNIAKSNGAKDHSYILSLRTNSKKNRPSAKKRRRRKAREQDIICYSLESDSNGDLQHDADLEFGQKCGSSSTLAFILGVGLEAREYKRNPGHTFYVSLSDGDDPDFSDDDSDTYDSEWESGDDPFCLFNFNCVGSQENVDQQPLVNDRIRSYNASWGIGDGCCQQAEHTKVHFPTDKNLAKIQPMIVWGYAYRAARKGPWEQFARDRERFSRKITDIQDVILPVLEAQHRNFIFNKRHSTS
ncbi:hypothetical protein ScPMuIL_015485 [Solemya velum]